MSITDIYAELDVYSVDDESTFDATYDGFSVVSLPKWRTTEIAEESIGRTDSFGRHIAWHADDSAAEYEDLRKFARSPRTNGYEDFAATLLGGVVADDTIVDEYDPEGITKGYDGWQPRAVLGLRDRFRDVDGAARVEVVSTLVAGLAAEGLLGVLDVQTPRWRFRDEVMRAARTGIANMDVADAYEAMFDIYNTLGIPEGHNPVKGTFAGELVKLINELYDRHPVIVAQRKTAKANKPHKGQRRRNRKQGSRPAAKATARPGDVGTAKVAKPAPHGDRRRNRNRRNRRSAAAK